MLSVSRLMVSGSHLSAAVTECLGEFHEGRDGRSWCRKASWSGWSAPSSWRWCSLKVLSEWGYRLVRADVPPRCRGPGGWSPMTSMTMTMRMVQNAIRSRSFTVNLGKDLGRS